MLSRSPATESPARDERSDYVAAYLDELSSYRAAGLPERANAVIAALRQLGHEVDKAPAGVKERAVAEAPLETVVPDEAVLVTTPKRRGRPKKATEPEAAEATA